MGLTHVATSLHVSEVDGTPVYRAECDVHQWAVVEENREVVDALVREHVREYPSVHCSAPPVPGPRPRIDASWPLASRIIKWTMVDGSVRYTGSCGQCSPRWDVFDSPTPVDDIMYEHWLTAHAADYGEQHG